jgi:hypothetical protein
MAAQDNLVEFFSFNTANDVSNVSFQRDCPVGEQFHASSDAFKA